MRRTIETILAILFASASILFVAFAAMVGRQTLDENADNSDAAYIVVAVTGLLSQRFLGPWPGPSGKVPSSDGLAE